MAEDNDEQVIIEGIPFTMPPASRIDIPELERPAWLDDMEEAGVLPKTTVVDEYCGVGVSLTTFNDGRARVDYISPQSDLQFVMGFKPGMVIVATRPPFEGMEWQPYEKDADDHAYDLRGPAGSQISIRYYDPERPAPVYHEATVTRKPFDTVVENGKTHIYEATDREGCMAAFVEVSPDMLGNAPVQLAQCDTRSAVTQKG